mgnify:CR=1 FL=1
MQTYTFFVKGKKVQVIPRNELTDSKKKELKENGFKKHHIEVDALSKNDAAIKLKESTDQNLEDLSSFSGSILFSVMFFIIVAALIYFFR